MAERLDLYATLGLNRSSRDLDIKRAYKRLALQNHPDKGKGTDAEFVAIGFAYFALSNPKLRASFDMNEVEFSTARRQLVADFDLAKALETFDSFFGTANPFAAVSDGVNKLFDEAEAANEPNAPASIHLPLVCTLEDLYNSVTKSVAVPKRKPGNDGAPVDFTKVYNVVVEPFWRSGTKLVYEKEPGDLTGDVVLTVEIAEHASFKVDGYNLRSSYTLPLHLALAGAMLDITMPDARVLHISVEEVVDPAMVRTVAGEGLVDKTTGKRGDLIVTFEIVFPKRLVKIQKDLLLIALRFPAELTDDSHIQHRLLNAAINLPTNLAASEREKVPAIPPTQLPALTESIWALQFGELELFSAPKLADLYLNPPACQLENSMTQRFRATR
eukprot:CAMPEP_0180283134 /NCGR_PEP_ID=MMETSP0988-20121125/10278_1 /TAXON_ID=697907 /ORGANISM="non described non described, Strain CCMP2293" /LENGTH=385 /DNA_ID=CAMNT_0022255575 /DNA_START=27 /DNA_END=1184 /DNA_ORIENTATION=+